MQLILIHVSLPFVVKTVVAFWHHFSSEIYIMHPSGTRYMGLELMRATTCPTNQKLDIEWE